MHNLRASKHATEHQCVHRQRAPPSIRTCEATHTVLSATLSISEAQPTHRSRATANSRSVAHTRASQVATVRHVIALARPASCARASRLPWLRNHTKRTHKPQKVTSAPPWIDWFECTPCLDANYRKRSPSCRWRKHRVSVEAIHCFVDSVRPPYADALHSFA